MDGVEQITNGQPDDELMRLGEVTERIAGADEEVRARILRYLNDRFGVKRAAGARRGGRGS